MGWNRWGGTVGAPESLAWDTGGLEPSMRRNRYPMSGEAAKNRIALTRNVATGVINQ